MLKKLTCSTGCLNAITAAVLVLCAPSTARCQGTAAPANGSDASSAKAAAASSPEQQPGFYLKDNDTVVFYGDRITEQRIYSVRVETFVATRYPSLNVSFVNSGGAETR